MKNNKTRISRLVGLCCASISLGSQISFAQEAEDPSLVEEVIVVASLRAGADLSSTAAAVTALSAENLITAGITDPTTLQDQIPNISIDRAGSNGLQITVRGVSSTDNTEKGDPSASFLQDGIYIARAQAQEVSFFDLEQVEVLRGPQGTLYGRNATAGIVHVISAKPKLGEFTGAVDGVVGDYKRRQATGILNVPVGESAAIRAAVNIDKRDTFLNANPASASDIDPGKDNLSMRLSGLFDLTEDINLLLRADYSTLEGTGRSSVRLSNFYDLNTVAQPDSGRGTDPTYIADGRSNDELSTVGWADNAQERKEGKNAGIMGELNWSLSDALTLTYIGSHREFERREYNLTGFSGLLNPPGVVITSNQRFIGDYEQDSHELRLSYENDMMNLQGGLYYFDEVADIEFLLFGALPFARNPGDDGYIFGFPQRAVSDSLALFAQGTFNLSDQLRLTAGARQNSDEKSRIGATIFHRALGEERNFDASESNSIPDGLNNAKVEYNELTWKLGLDYDLSDEVLVYATLSTGYKAGGFNDGCVAGAANCNNPLPEDAVFYDPETLTAFEAGVKIDLENGLRTYVSVFQYDYENLQLSSFSDICGGPCSVTDNAGEAEVTGLEIESRYILNDRNRVTGAFTWLSAEYTDYQLNETVNLKGDSLNRAPEFTLFLGYQHRMPLSNGGDIVLDANYRWSDSYKILNTNIVAQFEQPSFSKTDLTLTYNAPDDQWYVQAYVKNIEDELTIASTGLSAQFPTFVDGTVNLADPRTSGLRFGVKF